MVRVVAWRNSSGVRWVRGGENGSRDVVRPSKRSKSKLDFSAFTTPLMHVHSKIVVVVVVVGKDPWHWVDS